MSKTRLSYGVKLLKNGEVVLDTHSRSKRRILNRIRALPWENGFLRVSYRNEGGEIGDNKGEFSSEEELVTALFAFSEPGLIEFLESTQEAADD